MKLIRTDRGDVVKVDGEIEWRNYLDDYCCWGYRWNKNEGRFGKQCIQFIFNSYNEIDETALTVTKPLDLE